MKPAINEPNGPVLSEALRVLLEICADVAALRVLLGDADGAAEAAARVVRMARQMGLYGEERRP